MAPETIDLLNALPVAVVAIDPEGSVATINPAAEMLLNASAAHTIGRRVEDLIVLPSGFGADAGQTYTAFDADLLRKKGGAPVRADVALTPLPDHEGWRLLSIQLLPSTQQIGRTGERAAAQTAIGIAATLAHEIKNPLAGIRGAAQLLDGRVGENDARMTHLIRNEVDRIAALVDQMQGFTDTRPLLMEPVNIHEIVDHVRTLVASAYGESVRISEEYDPSLPMVEGHRDSLVQIVLNLMKNAAETAGAGEERQILLRTAFKSGVSVPVGEGGRRRSLPIELCVIDDGPGAPPEIADHLFEPFVSSKKSGRGLGLALAYKQVRAMGGLIQYVRQAAPPRTVLRVLLPRAGETAA